MTQNLMLNFWNNGFCESLLIYHSIYQIFSSQTKWKAENFPNVKESKKKQITLQNKCVYSMRSYRLGQLTINMFTQCCLLTFCQLQLLGCHQGEFQQQQRELSTGKVINWATIKSGGLLYIIYEGISLVIITKPWTV